MSRPLYRVRAEVVSLPDGGGDAAYALIMDDVTPGELLARLSSLLTTPVKDMLARGPHDTCGSRLTLWIYDADAFSAEEV